MSQNFDKIIDRSGTHCLKWEFIIDGDEIVYSDQCHDRYGDYRLLPLWVADMDFPSPPEVIQALKERAEHGLFGYSFPADSYYETLIDWMARRYGWTIERDWVTLTPGVVNALYTLVRTFTAPGDKVLIQRPVYHPFMYAIENHGAEIVSNSLVYEDGRYLMDFDDLAQKAADPAVKMVLLCSPHNPVGRVWTKEELLRFGEICLEHDLIVVSDEVHCDLIFEGHPFTAYGTLGDALAQNSIICTSPSKSFNLAGLKTSNIIIPNQDLREAFADTLQRSGIYGANAFGLVAVEAAYTHGEAWLAKTLAYIQANYRFMVDYAAEHLPFMKIVPLEGTYLVWVDFSALGLDPAARKKLLLEKARVFLDEGGMFGPEGADFERFNIACPRPVLAEAMERIRKVVGTGGDSLELLGGS